MSIPEQLMKPCEVSEFLQVSKDHLARLRMEGGGPPFVKIGKGRQGAVRYRMTAVLAFLESCERSNTSAA